MQPNKTKLALALGALLMGASGASNAGVETFNITVNTLPDVAITSVQTLTFGANMFVTAGGSCSMDASVPGDETLMQYHDNGNLTESASYGDLTGTGCVNADGTDAGVDPGVYKIKGIGEQVVAMTVTGVTNADFTFAPNSGCVVVFNNATATLSGDTCDTFVPGVAKTGLLLPAAAGSEEGTATPSGGTVEGEMMVTVGGTITIGGSDLTANQAYSDSFSIDVVY